MLKRKIDENKERRLDSNFRAIRILFLGEKAVFLGPWCKSIKGKQVTVGTAMRPASGLVVAKEQEEEEEEEEEERREEV